MIAYYLLGGIFMLLGFCCLLLIIAQLPGTWIMITLATLIQCANQAWLLPAGSIVSTAWWSIGIAFLIGIIGELIEFISSGVGAKAGGGSKRTAWGAIIGGMLGAILMTIIIPVPIIGTLIGVLIGCFLGAIIGDMTSKDRPTLSKSVVPAISATIGRVLGTTFKLIFGIFVWAILSYGLLSA